MDDLERKPVALDDSLQVQEAGHIGGGDVLGPEVRALPLEGEGDLHHRERLRGGRSLGRRRAGVRHQGRRQLRPHVTTLHGRLDLPDLPALYREFPEMPVVSISNAQRQPLPQLNWQGTVYHGLPENLLDFHPQENRYLAFVGRISPEKRVDRAIHDRGPHLNHPQLEE